MSDQEDTTLPGVQMPDPGTMTAALPVPDPVLVALTRIETAITSMGTTIDTIQNENTRIGLRLTRQEVRMEDVETRLGNNSMRVKVESAHDLEQDAQLAQERSAREALATKVDTLVDIAGRLDKLTKHPAAKVLGAIVAVALATYAASHGIRVGP